MDTTVPDIPSIRRDIPCPHCNGDNTLVIDSRMRSDNTRRRRRRCLDCEHRFTTIETDGLPANTRLIAGSVERFIGQVQASIDQLREVTTEEIGATDDDRFIDSTITIAMFNGADGEDPIRVETHVKCKYDPIERVMILACRHRQHLAFMFDTLDRAIVKAYYSSSEEHPDKPADDPGWTPPGWEAPGWGSD